MRELYVATITSAVEELFISANIDLSESVIARLKGAIDEERSPAGQEVLHELLTNAQIAHDEHIPICQDTGLGVVFLEIGQDVHFTGGDFTDAVTAGVRGAYKKGFLRKSCCDPFTRKNTGDNTPAIIHTAVVPGDRVRIVAMPKGGGSENYSEARMLMPSQGVEGVEAFVLEMVRKGGPNPCPPITVGVGVGGNFETCALLSKEALVVPYGQRSPDGFTAELEARLLRRINELGIGPQGYGGTVTALDVHVLVMPCHIASLPVAVNIQCHVNRIKEITI